MKLIRSRILVGLLFGLLSLGQAYPFSAAWGMSQKSHACCCQTATPKTCDCDHKGRASLKKKKFSCHEEKAGKGSSYSPAPCGAQTEARSLNFRGETCLPRFASFVTIVVETENFGDLSVRLPNVLAVPESPPPKG